MTDPIVSPGWLQDRLGDPSVVVLEVSRFEPEDAEYFSGHIPGSQYAYWKDLCWDPVERRFPDSAEMARRLGERGVGDEATLVLVGDTIQFATYPYWVLSLTGLAEGVVVLDGGRQTWELQGRPTTTTSTPPPEPAHRSPRQEDRSARVGRDDLLGGLGRPGRTLIDLRSDEEFNGLRVSPLTMPFDHGAERTGRIPGARHLYYERLLNADGTFKDALGIAAELEAVGADPSSEIVTYCRLSHRASLGWLVLTHRLGLERVRVYDGSWTEWGSMVGMPIER